MLSRLLFKSFLGALGFYCLTVTNPPCKPVGLVIYTVVIVIVILVDFIKR